MMRTKEFVKGALIGAALGVMLAPKSGKEMRQDIKDKYHEAKDSLMNEIKNTGEITRNKYNEVVNKVVSSFESAKKITSDEAHDIKEALSEGYGSFKKCMAKEMKKK